MPRKKVSTRKKATPRIKTQETFESQVKEELQSVTGSTKTTKLKKKRSKDTSLLDKAPAKPRAKKPPALPPKPAHHACISELDGITFDKEKFVTAKLTESFKQGSNGAYISSILYRNMTDFLKREQFYLGNVSGSEKTKIKAAIQKDLSYLKSLLRSM
ncbi:hypothetical protein HN803_03705 [candidate division WWE3 bacterium]|jgi:hypothetical protein|nr:hypothetical protein [candidate division WWE3 bacterium]